MILAQEPLQIFVRFGKIGPSSKTLKGTLLETNTQVLLLFRLQLHTELKYSYIGLQLRCTVRYAQIAIEFSEQQNM